MARFANQIVTVCVYLANSQPALVPVAEIQEADISDTSESDHLCNKFIIHDINHKVVTQMGAADEQFQGLHTYHKKCTV